MNRTTGTSTWTDLSVQDLDAAKAFYSGVFGWTFDDLGEEFAHYAMITNSDGAYVGGAMSVAGMTTPDGKPLLTGWDTYLAVDDVEARLAAALEKGATALSSIMDVGTDGRNVMLQDPTGASVGMWQAKEFEGYEFTGKPGSPVWFELMTHDFDTASAFYGAVFDAQFVPMGEPMDDDSFRYVTNGPAETASWGLCDASGAMPAEATGWRHYLAVDSTAAAIERIEEHGGRVLDGPIDSPFGRITTIADPEGATFQISAMSEAVPEG
ncbi:lactoylglutathione lyase [Brachybacterium avium]|uniref:Lactoylglutathione lyase n=1 Tax=Brachybacterium avium TaxID=2017485 RepID=A0A220UAL4_9MICO|nr:VOC family protein [Brachybacterium avium]ASK65065.1 lactoylglutathione lyase [Brachybacterium avium]